MKNDIKAEPLNNFLAEIKKNLNEDQILLSSNEIIAYKSNTESLDRNIELVIQPNSIKEIINIVMIATKHCIPLYPISRGANWGYGSAQPVNDNTVILDLKRLNKIIEVNENYGYAVIEPGVTQIQLSEYLKKHNSNFHFDPTGAGPNTSILGNILERGFGLGIFGDHYKSLNNFEIILPNGNKIKTGFWNEKNEEIAHCFTNSIGPDLRGLFTQANLGIITKASFDLTPVPQKIKLAIINCKDQSELFTSIDKLKDLFMQEALVAGCNITCSTRILTTIMQYPWNLTKNKVPLPKKVKNKLIKKFKLKEWTILVPLRGTINQVKAQEKDLKSVINKKISIKIYHEEKIDFYLKTLSKLPIKFGFYKTALKMKSFFEFLKGEPKDMTLASPYWRNRKNPKEGERNPALDNCGLIWMAPTIPFSGEKIDEFLKITIPTLHKYGLDDAISILYANKKSLISTLPLLYDKESEIETHNAHKCYIALSKLYETHGFLAYRKPIHSMPTYDNAEYRDFIKRIKKNIDPENIIAPGRYC